MSRLPVVCTCQRDGDEMVSYSLDAGGAAITVGYTAAGQPVQMLADPSKAPRMRTRAATSRRATTRSATAANQTRASRR
jgi:hypothetical protein